MNERRAVFLDRDGVINRAVVRNGTPHPPQSVADLEILPEVPGALGLLRAAGFRLVVVTNQPDVARGAQDRSVVEAIHAGLLELLPLDAVRVCYHDDADRCACRKPKPGLLVQAAWDMALELKDSFMVGDRWRDIDAGREAGCRTVHIDRGYAEMSPRDPDRVATDLADAAEWILQCGASGGVTRNLKSL